MKEGEPSVEHPLRAALLEAFPQEIPCVLAADPTLRRPPVLCPIAESLIEVMEGRDEIRRGRRLVELSRLLRNGEGEEGGAHSDTVRE